MGCTRQVMRRVAIQRSDTLRARFMAEVSIYDPIMLVWQDETCCDRVAIGGTLYANMGTACAAFQFVTTAC